YEVTAPGASPFDSTGVEQLEILTRLRVGEVAIGGVKIADVVRGPLVRHAADLPLDPLQLAAAVAGNFQSGRSMERHRKVGGEQKSPRFALYRHREGFDDVFLIGVAEERPGTEKQAQRRVDRRFATVVPGHAKSRLGK